MESAFHRNGLLWVVPLLLLISVAFARGAFAEKAQGVEEGKESDWRVYWDDGLFIKTKDNEEQ